MQEICRIGQDFLYISFVCVTFRSILCRICVGNVRKCHVLVHRIRRKSYIWSSVWLPATGDLELEEVSGFVTCSCQ